MQFALIAYILLLVPLASTASVAQPTGAPYFKLLFQDGFVLTEGSNVKIIDFGYKRLNSLNKIFSIETQKENSIFTEWMYFKPNLVNNHPGFAVESYHTTTDFRLKDEKSCLKNANEEVKHLIHDCDHHIKIRSLTKEEKVQIEQYKKEQRDKPWEPKKPFEVLHDRTRVTSKSNDLQTFHYEDNNEGLGDHRFYFWTVKTFRDFNSVYLLGKLATKSFVIEGVPEESKDKCAKFGLDDLTMTSCSGKIRVRPN